MKKGKRFHRAIALLMTTVFLAGDPCGRLSFAMGGGAASVVDTLAPSSSFDAHALHGRRLANGRKIFQAISDGLMKSYNVRGIACGPQASMTPAFAYAAAVALAQELNVRVSDRRPRVLVTGDHRDTTPALRQAFIDGLRYFGIDVDYSTELTSTPAASVVSRLPDFHYDAAVQVTASHNTWTGPRAENGFKISLNDEAGYLRGICKEELCRVLERMNEPAAAHIKPPAQWGAQTQKNLLDHYKDHLRQHFLKLCEELGLTAEDRSKLVLVVDSGNAVMGPIAQEVIESLGMTCVGVHDTVMGNRDSLLAHEADPIKRQYYQEHLPQEVQKVGERFPGKIILGVSLDGDGDRVGLTDESGRQYLTQPQMAYLFHHLERQRNPDAPVLLDMSSGQELVELAGENGHWCSPGWPLMRRLMRETSASVAVEVSQHVFMRSLEDPQADPIDDGLWAGLTAAIQAARLQKEGTSIHQMLSGVSWLPSLPEELRPQYVGANPLGRYDEAARIARDVQQRVSEAFSSSVIQTIRSPEEEGTLRIQIADDQGHFLAWVLVRASNTETKFSISAQARDGRVLARIAGVLREALDRNPNVEQGEVLRLLGSVTGRSMAADLENSNEIVRISAVSALSDLKDPQYIPLLEKALGDSSAIVRAVAVRALREFKNPENAMTFVRLLKDPDTIVRHAAAEALEELKDRRTIPALACALYDEDAIVRNYAITALGEMIGTEYLAVFITEHFHAEQQDRIGAIIAWAEKGIADAHLMPVFTEILKSSKSVALRQLAAQTLRQYNNPETVPVFIGALKDWDDTVRGTAAEALGDFGDPRAIEPLISSIGGAEETQNIHFYVAKKQVLSALCRFVKDPRVAGVLESVFQNSLNDVVSGLANDLRKTAHAAQGTDDDMAVAAFMTLGKAARVSAEIRTEAVTALGELQNPVAVELLTDLLTDEAVGDAVYDALLRIGKAGMEDLKAKLHSYEVSSQGQARIIRSILARLDDDDTVRQARISMDWDARMADAMAYRYQRYGQIEDLHCLEDMIAYATGNVAGMHCYQPLGYMERGQVRLARWRKGHDQALEEAALRGIRSCDASLSPEMAKDKVPVVGGQEPVSIAPSPVNISEVLEAFNRPSPSMVPGDLQESQGNLLTHVDKERLRHYRQFQALVSRLRVLLQEGKLLEAAEILNRMEYPYQVLEVTKLLAAPEAMENLSAVMLLSDHYWINQGDLIVRAVAELGREDLAALVWEGIQSGRTEKRIQEELQAKCAPAVQDRLWREVQTRIHAPVEKQSLAESLEEVKDALGFVRQAQECYEKDPAKVAELLGGVMWTRKGEWIVNAVLSSESVPVDCKKILIESIVQAYQKGTASTPEHYLTPDAPRELFPIIFAPKKAARSSIVEVDIDELLLGLGETDEAA